MTMDTICDPLAPSMSTADPFLGSPWERQEFDLDCQDLETSNLANTNHDDHTNSGEVDSPSHGLDHLMELQPNSPVLANHFEDWGALDDILYRQQSERDLSNKVDEQSMDVRHGTVHSPMFSTPGTTSDPSSASVATSSVGFLSSSLPSSLPELQSFENISITPLEPLRRPQPTLSRSGSISSVQSERGRTRVKDKKKVQRLQPGDSSAFYEHIFDSDPIRSTSRASASSGRRGPLDMEARATMNAVKEIGACWRCKSMRKSCNADRPCDACSKIPQSSHWRAVGCRRGALKNQMPRITLCPKTATEHQARPISTKDAAGIENEWVLANTRAEDIIQRRNREISRAIQTAETWNDKMEALLTSLRTGMQDCVDDEAKGDGSANPAPCTTSKPLEDKISAILWELYGNTESPNLLNDWIDPQGGTLEKFVSLLSLAAAHEVKSNNKCGDLITQSLSCLRHCLEALRLQASGHFEKLSHQACGPSACRSECIRSLALSLELCADIISTSLSKKENIRGEAYWVSTFYSLCLQSVVRRGLMLLDRQATDTGQSLSHLHEHFRMAVRLFMALSGSFDPLNQDLSMEAPSSADDISRIEGLIAAQVIVNRPRWPGMGFACSGDYLRHLFDDLESSQDDGKGQCASELGTADFTIHPEPYLPENFDVESYRKLRNDWDLARCNYTKHTLLVGPKYGWNSEVYLLTEEKWASVDAVWKKHSRTALENILKNANEARSPNDHDKATKHDIRFDAFLECSEEHGRGKPFPEPGLHASLRQNPDPRDTARADDGAYPEEQLPRFPGDIYWPRWIRGQEGSIQEGWCGICTPGRWLPLDGTFQDDKDFKHGVSAVTGKPFHNPKKMRRMKVDPRIWWGLCGTCGEWVEILGSKTGEIGWFVHSFGCYT